MCDEKERNYCFIPIRKRIFFRNKKCWTFGRGARAIFIGWLEFFLMTRRLIEKRKRIFCVLSEAFANWRGKKRKWSKFWVKSWSFREIRKLIEDSSRNFRASNPFFTIPKAIHFFLKIQIIIRYFYSDLPQIHSLD